MLKAASTSRKSAPITTVDDYLAGIPEGMREALQPIRRAIRAAAPEAEELISYRIPAYRQNGMLVFFAAFKDHCSMFVASKAVVKSFSKDLAGFRAAGATIHFSPEKPLPVSLVKKMVQAKLAENEARRKKRTKPATAERKAAKKSSTATGRKK